MKGDDLWYNIQCIKYLIVKPSESTIGWGSGPEITLTRRDHLKFGPENEYLTFIICWFEYT